METVEKIEKERIGNLKFTKKEVLIDQEEIKNRWLDLCRAQALGNLQHGKVNIIFFTADEKIYQVSTTVWAVGQEFVTLKGGIHIPVNAIQFVH